MLALSPEVHIWKAEGIPSPVDKFPVHKSILQQGQM